MNIPNILRWIVISSNDAYDDKTITLPHVSTELQHADILTKALPRARHQFLVSKLLLVNPPSINLKGGIEVQ